MAEVQSLLSAAKHEPADIARSLGICLSSANCKGCILEWNPDCMNDLRRMAKEAIESLLEENAGLVGDLKPRIDELMRLQERNTDG